MKTKSCAKSFAFELGTPVNYIQNYQNGKFLPKKKNFKLNLNIIDKSISPLNINVTYMTNHTYSMAF